MTPPAAPVISARTAAVLASDPAMRRLRIRYRADPEVYRDLLVLSVLGLAWSTGHADTTGILISGSLGDDRTMTTTEAAQLAGVGADAIRRAAREGRVKATRHAGRWLILATEAATYRRRGDGCR